MSVTVNGGIQFNFMGGLLNIFDSAKELFSLAGPTIKRKSSSGSSVGGGKRK